MDANHEIIVHAASYHFDRAADYNERNTGLAIKTPVGKYFTQAGAYRNSEYRDSFYVGLGKEAQLYGILSARVHAGAVSGYALGTTLYIMPELVARFGRFSAIVGALPDISIDGRYVAGMVSLSMGVAF